MEYVLCGINRDQGKQEADIHAVTSRLSSAFCKKGKIAFLICQVQKRSAYGIPIATSFTVPHSLFHYERFLDHADRSDQPAIEVVTFCTYYKFTPTSSLGCATALLREVR
jgi:hypothetical protein